jgi:hypothetical protein
MNAGLSSLNYIKTQLLAEALRAGTRYDVALQLIGTGMAGLLEKFCNRKFARTEVDTFTCSADRDHIYLPRSPVETITSTELKLDETTGWEVQTGFIFNRNDATGHVYWGSLAGPDYGHLRFTYTGGYWFDTTEEGNDTLPSGATALPEDLRLAWILQCRIAWQAIDKLGKDIVATGSSSQFVTGTLAGLALNDQVKELLAGYRRYQLT